MKNLKLSVAAIGSLSLLALMPTNAQIIITEVDPSGSGNANGYVQDWFELTNYGLSSVSLADWKMDDNSNSFSSAVPFAFPPKNNSVIPLKSKIYFCLGAFNLSIR